MTSKLERLPDKILFSIIKSVFERCESDGISIKRYDDENQRVIESILRIYGVVEETINYMDNDFVFSTLKLNLDKISNKKLEGSLNRPEIKNYTFDIDVHETVYQRTTWRHKISSYSNDPYDIVKEIDNDGNLDYWDGRELDRDIYDSEINKITIDAGSFEQI